MSKLKVVCAAIMTASVLSVSQVAFSQETAGNSAEVQARMAWRDTVMHQSSPDKRGCFHVAYPKTEWSEVACTTAPNRPFAHWLPNSKNIVADAALANGRAQTVGDGVDYVAEVPGLLSYSVGGFTTVSNVTSETGALGANDYSLQLNSNFMNTSACSGHSGCLAWQQFIYSSGEQAVFMQYWLINYGTCPSGWNTYGSSCWMNSAAVSVPEIPISELKQLSVWANAYSGSYDQVGLGTGNYSVPGGITAFGGDFFLVKEPDSVLYLTSDWKESEFNIFGDGGGSAATFNSGASLQVLIQLGEQGGALSAPTCVSNAGTTGETNNLTLGGCSATAGTSSTNPSISFGESN
jgi:hypothetical protein